MHVTGSHTYRTEVYQRAAILGLNLECLFDFVYCTFGILERRYCARMEDQRVNVFGISAEQRRHASLGVVETASQEQNFRHFELDVAIVRQGVGGSNEFQKRRAKISHSLVRFGELQSRFPELWIETNRARIFDDGEFVALLHRVRIPALKVAPLLDLRIAARGRHRRNQQEYSSNSLRHSFAPSVTGPELAKEIERLENCRNELSESLTLSSLSRDIAGDASRSDC
jgi:hypothetical protein